MLLAEEFGRFPRISRVWIHISGGSKAKRAGITKWVGFHTFRHTYSTLLANGEDVKVVQELMRHANLSTTMNIYTKALTPAKREAQSRWSTFFWIDRGRPRRVQHENQRIESVSRFFCEPAKLLV
jgi:integrase